MTAAEQYTYQVRPLVDEEGFVGTVAELPSLSWVAASQLEAFTGILSLVSDVLQEMKKSGEIPP